MSVAARAPELVGSVTPRVRLVPDAIGSSGVEAYELAASVGLQLDQWQYGALVDALGETEAGLWSAFEVGLIVPRQNGKGAIIEARELAGLFLFDERLILHTAHEFKTAQEAFRRVLFWIENSDDLRPKVKRVRTSHGEEGIELLSGARLRFVARSTGSGRGFTGDTLVFDEAYNLGAHTIAALIPTLSAVPNPQIWYTSTAGLADSTLRAVRDRGEAAEDDALCYLEWSAPEDADLDDRAAWAQANPALGIRISEAFVAKERRAMAAAPIEFARERLGVWDSKNTIAVIDAEKWAACLDPSSSIDGELVLAVDVAPGMTQASISVAGWAGEREHVEVIAHGEGATWVVPRLVELAARHKPEAIIFDPRSEAGGLLQAAIKAELDVQTVNVQEYARACTGIVAAVNDGTLAHLGQVQLDVALTGARKRKIGDAFVWDRLNATTDITPLVAVTLARYGLGEFTDGADYDLMASAY